MKTSWDKVKDGVMIMVMGTVVVSTPLFAYKIYQNPKDNRKELLDNRKELLDTSESVDANRLAIKSNRRAIYKLTNELQLKRALDSANAYYMRKDFESLKDKSGSHTELLRKILNRLP